MGVFQFISNSILAPTLVWAGIAGKLTALVLVPVLVGVSITVFWHGFNILRGAHGAHHFLDIFAKLIRSFLVVSIALAGGAYASNVIGFFNDLRTGLTGLFIGGNPSNSYDALDDAMMTAFGTFGPMLVESDKHISFGLVGASDITGVLMILGWFILVACLGIFCALCAFNLIFVDISLNLMFALGPMFIACMAFSSTARFADTWISGVLKYVLTAVAVSAVVGIGIGIVKTYASKLGADPSIINWVVQAINASIAVIILGLFVSKIPQVAADMVGGSALSLMTPKDGVVAGLKELGIPKDSQNATNGGIEKALRNQFGPPGGGGDGDPGGHAGSPSGMGNITSGRDSLGVQAATASSSTPPAAAAAAVAAMSSTSNSTSGSVLHAKSDSSSFKQTAGSVAASDSIVPLSASGLKNQTSFASSIAPNSSFSPVAVSVTSPAFASPTYAAASASTAAALPGSIGSSQAALNAPALNSSSYDTALVSVASGRSLGTAPAPGSTAPGLASGSASATAPVVSSTAYADAVSSVSFNRPIGTVHSPGKA